MFAAGTSTPLTRPRPSMSIQNGANAMLALFQAQSTGHLAHIQDLNETIQRLETELNAAKLQNAIQPSLQDCLQSIMGERDTALQQAKEGNERSLREKVELQQAHDETLKELRSLRESTQANIVALTAEKESLITAHHNLRAELDARIEENGHASEFASNLQGELVEIANIVHKVPSNRTPSLQSLKEDITLLASQHDLMVYQVDEKTKATQALQEQVDVLTTERQQLRKDLETRDATIKRLEESPPPPPPPPAPAPAPSSPSNREFKILRSNVVKLGFDCSKIDNLVFSKEVMEQVKGMAMDVIKQQQLADEVKARFPSSGLEQMLATPEPIPNVPRRLIESSKKWMSIGLKISDVVWRALQEQDVMLETYKERIKTKASGATPTPSTSKPVSTNVPSKPTSTQPMPTKPFSTKASGTSSKPITVNSSPVSSPSIPPKMPTNLSAAQAPKSKPSASTNNTSSAQKQNTPSRAASPSSTPAPKSKKVLAPKATLPTAPPYLPTSSPVASAKLGGLTSNSAPSRPSTSANLKAMGKIPRHPPPRTGPPSGSPLRAVTHGPSGQLPKSVLGQKRTRSPTTDPRMPKKARTVSLPEVQKRPKPRT